MRIADILDFLKAEKISFTFVGDEQTEVEGFSSLGNYKSGTFTWVKKQTNLTEELDADHVTLAIVTEGVRCYFPNTVYSPDSKRAFFGAIEHFYERKKERPAIGQFTYLAPEVKLGKGVTIGHNCTLDGDITIGDNTVIENNVVIVNRVSIGENCIIHSGAVIGHSGFSYLEDSEHHKEMVAHLGGVQIGNNVWIGNNTTIDRSEIDDTCIDDGCKIDSLVHIAHNVHLGEDSVVISSANLMGSVHIQKNAYVSAALIRNQCRIGENAVVGMGSVVVKNVDADTTVIGNPAKPFENNRK